MPKITGKAVMTRERLEEIMEDDELGGSNIMGKDNALEGCKILEKYRPGMDVIEGAEHDEIYGPDVDDILEAGLTEEDASALRALNWHIDEDSDCLCCFV